MKSGSLEKLQQCEGSLQELFLACDLVRPVIVITGARSEQEQLQKVAQGLSQTVRSKHMLTPSQAVDFTPSPYVENDIAGCIAYWKEVIVPEAKARGLALRWGGNWTSIKDYGHVELAADAAHDDVAKEQG